MSEKLVTKDMEAQMLRRMAALCAKYPDKRIALDWDFDSVVYGAPRMVVKLEEKNNG